MQDTVALVDSWLERLQIEQEAFIPADRYYYTNQNINQSIIEGEGIEEHSVEVVDSDNNKTNI